MGTHSTRTGTRYGTIRVAMICLHRFHTNHLNSKMILNDGNARAIGSTTNNANNATNPMNPFLQFAQAQAQAQQPNSQQGQPPMGMGMMGNPMGMTPQQVSQMMQNPMVQQMMSQMFSNPENVEMVCIGSVMTLFIFGAH